MQQPDPASLRNMSHAADRSFTDKYDAEKIAHYYGKKFRQNSNYVLDIVRHAAIVGKEQNVSPFILLAIISHESNFQHLARNKSGAEGLMQIITKVHRKRFERYGGVQATFLPKVNIQVGAAILRECIGLTKSVHRGLRCYAGTLNSSDGGFVNFVQREAAMLRKMAAWPSDKVVR